MLLFRRSAMPVNPEGARYLREQEERRLERLGRRPPAPRPPDPFQELVAECMRLPTGGLKKRQRALSAAVGAREAERARAEAARRAEQERRQQPLLEKRAELAG